MCFEDDSPPPAPTIIQPPAPQSVGSATAESQAASLEGLKNLLNSGVLGQYAQQQTDINKAQAPQLNQLALDQSAQFGPQQTQLFLDRLKQIDPTGFQGRQDLGNQIFSDLGLGGQLSPEQSRYFQQDIRAAQEASGRKGGLGDILDEARFVGLGRDQMKQQRTANAMGYLGLSAPGNQLAGTTQVGAPTQNIQSAAAGLMPTVQQGLGYISGANQQGAANAMGLNALAQSNFQYNDQNTSNPFLTGLSTVGSLAAQVAGGYLGGRR